MLYSISAIIQDYHIKSLTISFVNNIKTGGKENREDDTSGIGSELPVNSGTYPSSSKYRFCKVKKKLS